MWLSRGFRSLKSKSRKERMSVCLPVRLRELALTAACVAFVSLAAPAAPAVPAVPEEKVVTLYRNSTWVDNARIHVATFDAYEGLPEYNAEMCQIAAGLFKGQEGVSPKIRYWCEHGRFRKTVNEKN